jgi:hypothetical protein
VSEPVGKLAIATQPASLCLPALHRHTPDPLQLPSPTALSIPTQGLVTTVLLTSFPRYPPLGILSHGGRVISPQPNNVIGPLNAATLIVQQPLGQGSSK